MRHFKHATKLFFLGWLIGTIVGVGGGGTPAFLGWRFSFLDLNAGTITILSNNLIAAFFASLGPLVAARILRIEPDDMDGIAFLYMIPTLIVFVNGFSLGFFTGSITGRLTPLLIFLSVAPHGVFEIPAIILSSAIGFTNIEDLGKRGIVDGKYIPLILLLIFAGGFIEGNVTGELKVLKEPIEILDVSVPEQVSAGVVFPLNITIENSGILDKGYNILISGDGGPNHGGGGLSERLFEDNPIPLGTNNISKMVALMIPGDNTLNVEVNQDGWVVSGVTVNIEVLKPGVSITGVSNPPLYAGEEAVTNVSLLNRDGVEREVEVLFESSTGYRESEKVVLAPGESIVYSHMALMGQPGPRIFNISLLWNGFTLDRTTTEAVVLGLRIRPVITSVDLPVLVMNRSSVIRVGVENRGTIGGVVSVLAFDSLLPQVIDQGNFIGIDMRGEQLGSGLRGFKDFYLGAGQKREVKLEVGPIHEHVDKLLVFTINKVVVSDVVTVDINPVQPAHFST